jgi:hypothetical protein
MAKVDLHFAWSPVAHGVGQWAGGAAKERIICVTVNQDVIAAETPHDFLAKEAGYSLAAVIPKHDPPVLIGQVDSSREVLQDGAVDTWIVKSRHKLLTKVMNRLKGREP